MGVNNLPRVAAQQCTGRESNLQPLDHKSNALPLNYQAKMFINGPERQLTHFALGLNRQDIKVLVGHSTLSRHLSIMKLLSM